MTLPRSALSRRTPLRHTSKKRGGLSRSQQADLKELNRSVVMLRHGAFLFEEGKARRWFGECAICHKPEKWLQVCHIFSQGKYRRAAYLPENCFAACWRCHLGPGGWHLEPTWAMSWIEKYLGAPVFARLKLRVETAGPVDYTTTRLWLLEEIKKLEAA